MNADDTSLSFADRVEAMDREDATDLALTHSRRQVLAKLSPDELRRYGLLADQLRRGDNVGVLRDALALVQANPTLCYLSKHSLAGTGRTIYWLVDPDDPSRLVRNRCLGYFKQQHCHWVQECRKLHAAEAVAEKRVDDLFSVGENQPAASRGHHPPATL